MIYFIQDQGSTNIKIGFSDVSAESRQKNGQTWSPFGLVVLLVIAGGKKEEAELHARFASARISQDREWFRPVPELLQLIILETEKKSRGANIHAEPEHREKWPFNIYLAGKIEKNCWRHSIVDGLREARIACRDGDIETLINPWPVLSFAIFREHNYVGPFFVGCDHGGFHGEDTHGVLGDADCCGARQRFKSLHGEETRLVTDRCFKAIAKADLVFAWIDQPDCYGTITELGFAASLGKRIWIAGPRKFRDMWFAYELAEMVSFEDRIVPAKILENWLDQMAPQAEPTDPFRGQPSW